jgi:cytoskeletal protein RodZ
MEGHRIVKNIGAKLQAAREEKGLSVEDATRETNIARRYITALEAEDFSQFPAEAYVLGFLKNYGEYLGLDVKELHNQYKVLKIQEQPVPVNELLNKPSRLPRVLIRASIAAASVLLVCGAVYFIISAAKRPADTSAAERKPVEYDMVNGILEQRFFPGDSVRVPVNEEFYTIELANLGEVVTLRSPQGNIVLGLNQDAVIDANEDGFSELRIQAGDYAQNKPHVGALLRFEMHTPAEGDVPLAAAPPDAASESGTPAPTPPAAAPAPASKEAQEILSGANPYPFTLEISFQANCMFRWEKIREANARGEGYMVRGDERTISAQNGIRLWFSNAGAAKIQVVAGGRTVPLEIGPAGTVAVADVVWRRGEDGRQRLVLSRLEN